MAPWLIFVNPPEIDRESTSDSVIEVRSQDNPFSSPILDSSRYYPVGPFIPGIASPNYSAFSFEPYTPVTIEDLSLEADRLSINQGPTRDPYLLHYNQPLTDSSRPIVQQLTEPSVSTWQNNTLYQQILRDSHTNRPISFARGASSSYSTPDMSLFETNEPLLTEENLGDRNNIMDNVFYNMNYCLLNLPRPLVNS